MTKTEEAVALFKDGYNCAQAVLAAFAPELGLARELALRIATPFGGGMHRMEGICGALAGAILAIGLEHGTVKAGDREAKENAYRLVRDLTEAFRARHGTLLCKELLGFDLSTPDGFALARGKGLFKTLCPTLVRDAAEILAPML